MQGLRLFRRRVSYAVNSYRHALLAGFLDVVSQVFRCLIYSDSPVSRIVGIILLKPRRPCSQRAVGKQLSRSEGEVPEGHSRPVSHGLKFVKGFVAA